MQDVATDQLQQARAYAVKVLSQSQSFPGLRLDEQQSVYKSLVQEYLGQADDGGTRRRAGTRARWRPTPARRWGYKRLRPWLPRRHAGVFKDPQVDFGSTSPSSSPTC